MWSFFSEHGQQEKVDFCSIYQAQYKSDKSVWWSREGVHQFQAADSNFKTGVKVIYACKREEEINQVKPIFTPCAAAGYRELDYRGRSFSTFFPGKIHANSMERAA
jgi:hypothetical protein